MKRIIDFLPKATAKNCLDIWCDSNAGSTYSICVRPGQYAPNFKQEISEAINRANGGHNGVDIQEGDTLLTGNTIDIIDPEWTGDN